VLPQKLHRLRQARNGGWIKWCITDANPVGLNPADDVFTTALEHPLVGELGMMAADELKDFPQAVCVFRQFAEEVGFKRIEWRHHLTKIMPTLVPKGEHFFL